MLKKLIWIMIIGAVLVYTIPKLLESFSLFIDDFFNTDDIEEISDTTIILPPILDSVPSATNSAKIKIRGYAENADRVELFVNDISKKDIRVKSDSSFSTNIPLFQGENEITVIAYDEDKNTSKSTKPVFISYIADGPDLIVDSPIDEDEIRGGDGVIEVRGLTDPDVNVTVNGRWAQVDESGVFVYSYRLQDGENKIEIIVTDPGGNTSTITRTVRYSK